MHTHHTCDARRHGKYKMVALQGHREVEKMYHNRWYREKNKAFSMHITRSLQALQCAENDRLDERLLATNCLQAVATSAAQMGRRGAVKKMAEHTCC